MLPSDQPDCPRRTANFLSLLTFAWIIPFFMKGSQKDLALEDVYRVMPSDETKKLADRCESAWFEEIGKALKKNGKKGAGGSVGGVYGGGGEGGDVKKDQYEPSLVKALIKVFGPKLAFLGIFPFVEETGIKVAQPVLLGYLLDYFNNPSAYAWYSGYLFAFGVVGTAILYATCDHPYKFAVQHLGMQMRICLCSLIYRKALRVSKYAMGQTQAGQITNFLSSDMNRFDVFFTFFHYTWTAPIQLFNVIIVLYFYADLGYASFAGLILIFLFVPFQGYMGSKFSKLRTQTADKTDERLLTLQEVLMAMRVIKMYTWEKPFANLVTESRQAEVKKLKKTAVYRALNQSFFSVTSRTTLFITLIAYVLTGHGITARKVYVTLSLYHVVQLVMTLYFPMAIISCAETLVALGRIKKFLMMEEKNLAPPVLGEAQLSRVRRYDWQVASAMEDGVSDGSQYTYTTASFGTTSNMDVGVWARNISARWNPAVREMSFSDVSFEVRAGEVLALIGPTASGKSSILNCLLYELPINSGEIKTAGKIAYAAQEAWVFNGSVRENILFGKPYNAGWYDEVTEACALTKDFQLLPYGDRTLVGEKGSELSGGQKARVTLARAVYADADIYLMDDPLSAVDAQVGRHIVEKCILGLLKNKCRILVTHQLQHVKLVDKIIVMVDGFVAHTGDFRSLQRSGIPFSELVNPAQAQEAMSTTKSLGNKESASSIGIPDKAADMNFTAVKMATLDKPEEVEEFVAKGSIGLKSFYKYFHAGSSHRLIFSMITFYIFTQALVTGTDLWLQFWVSTERSIHYGTMKYSKVPFIRYIEERQMVRMLIYTGLIVVLIILYQIRTQMFFHRCMNSSIVIYDRMFFGVVRSPISFFERTPVGRILNRFAKDISIIDEMLPAALYDVTEIFMQSFGILFLICINAHKMVVPCLLFMLALYLLRKFYFRTAIALKRLEGVARSPIFSHLSNTLCGLSTIRAFGVEQKFMRDFEEIHDVHNSTWYMFLATTRWLGLTVDWVVGVFISGVALNFLINLDASSEDSGMVGATIVSAMMMTSILQWGMRQSAEVENHLIAFERVSEYCDLQPEAALDSAPDKKPPPSWPSSGEIKIQNLCLRYSENNGNGATVLKNISCNINGGEKIGIVGRTGAGKSSLINVLFRLAEPTSGYIEIDGIETTSIGLHDLRAKISIIPQEPVIFGGTIRTNLDPFSDYTDAQLWNALQEVHLRNTIKHMEGGLDSIIGEGGSNFSVGQKQLFCLARCILKSNKVLVLDEATANIDPETDKLIQKTIRKNFGECTVLTIAHRLHTVMDSDRILVLHAGMIMEFDEPQVLLCDRHSMLYNLVKQTGKIEALNLAQIAKVAAQRRRPAAQQEHPDAMSPRGSQAQCVRSSGQVSSTTTNTSGGCSGVSEVII